MASWNGCEFRASMAQPEIAYVKEVCRLRFLGRNAQADRKRYLFPALYRIEAAAVEFEEVLGILVGSFRRHAALKAHSRRSGFAVPGSGGDKLHQIESNIFVAPHARAARDCFFHEC